MGLYNKHGKLHLSSRRKKNRGQNLRKSWEAKMKLKAEMEAAGLTTESQASTSTSGYHQPSPETILPTIDVKHETSPGIIIKQEIIETEEEYPIYDASFISAGLPSNDCPANVSGTTAVFHLQETSTTYVSSSGNESQYGVLRSNSNKSTQTSKTDSAGESRDQCDVFGELIASELRSMDANTRAIVRKVISELVYEVKVGKLLTHEEKTNLALNTSDLINSINSVYKMVPPNSSDQMVLPNVDEQAIAASDVVMEESSSVVSDSPSAAPERSLEMENASVTQTSCYPHETEPTILDSSENVAKSVGQKATEQHSQSMDTMTAATGSHEIDVAKLNSDSQLRNTNEASHISKIVRMDQDSDVGSTRDQRDIFGEFIIIELKKMDTITNSIVQKLISELIFEANIGIHLGDQEKTNLAYKRCIFITRLRSADKSPCDKTDCPADKNNQNHSST